MVLSDVHLAEAGYDEPIAYAIDTCLRNALAERAIFKLVLAGDVLDPELIESASEPRSEPGAVLAVRRILEKHPKFVQSLSNILKYGGNIRFLPGNHDAQLAFPAVRNVIAQALEKHVNRGNVAILDWLHCDGDLLVEHGHLYDPICSVDRMDALGSELESTIGTVLTRKLAKAPGINASAVDPIAEAREKGLLHTIDGLSITSAMSALRDALCVHQTHDSESRMWLTQVAHSNGLHVEALKKHRLLTARKASIDQILPDAWNYGKSITDAQVLAAHQISKIHNPKAKIIVMGHTHNPISYQVGPQSFFLNSGCWPQREKVKAVLGSFVLITQNLGRTVDARIIRLLENGQFM